MKIKIKKRQKYELAYPTMLAGCSCTQKNYKKRVYAFLFSVFGFNVYITLPQIGRIGRCKDCEAPF